MYLAIPAGSKVDVEVSYNGLGLIPVTTYDNTAGITTMYVTDHRFKTYNIPAPPTSSLIVTVSNVTNPGTVPIKIQFSPVLLQEPFWRYFTHQTNCISYRERHECTKRINSWCYGYAYGFFFGLPPSTDAPPVDFLLSQRLRIVSFNPTYPTSPDVQIYSNGDDELTFATRKKYKTLHLDKVDEVVHDCASVQIACSHLFVDDDRYVAKKGDYIPEWDKDGKKKLVPARVELARKNNNIFFTKQL